jgi:hypothetical protein
MVKRYYGAHPTKYIYLKWLSKTSTMAITSTLCLIVADGSIGLGAI